MAKKPLTPSATPEVAVSISPRLSRLYLGAACFFSGAAMMIIEISAARLLSPLFGNSVYTWTSLIGVILVAFSVGGYYGGRLADRRVGVEVIGWLLAVVAVLTYLIPTLGTMFSPLFAKSGLIDGPILFSIFLLAVPGALLGAVSPAAVRLYSLTSKDSAVGSSAGTISMLGSLGSFVGTFLSGFVLLSNFGVRSIFIGTATLLLALAIAAFFLGGRTLLQQVPVLIGGLLTASISALTSPAVAAGVIHEEESFYHRIQVTESGQSPHKERLLKLDSTHEGGMNADTGALILAYQHYWRLGMLRDQPLKSALFIGAGAFGMPEEVSRTFPEAHIDVAEIDPKVIETGRKFFKLDEYPKVHAHAGDARHFLRTRADQKWDLVFGDAYNGVHAIPPHLATKEFFQLISDHLTPEGTYIMNIIANPQGPRSELLAGMLTTLRSVFPHVEAFPVQGGSSLQNIILMASHQDFLPLIKDRFYAAGSWQSRLTRSHLAKSFLPSEGPLFTDDFNPVDSIIARALLK